MNRFFFNPLSGHFLFTFLICLLLPFLFFSCYSEDDCSRRGKELVLVQFSDMAGRPVSVRYDSVGTYVDNENLLIINKQSNWVSSDSSKYHIFLYPLVENVSFIFFKEDNDTLEVTYEKNHRVISAECGLEQLYVNLSVSRSTFNSVNINQKNLLKFNNEPNIEIIP
jgi:hypothetical protein